jgi:hypothetical protein
MLETMSAREERLNDPIGAVTDSLCEVFGDAALQIAMNQYDAAEGHSRFIWARILARLGTPEVRL